MGRNYKKNFKNNKVVNESPSLGYSGNVSQEMMDAFSNIPFNIMKGSPVTLNGKSFTVEGAITFDVHPSIGKSKVSEDPINISANRYYTWIRKDQSGSKNYDAPDLAMYLLAMAGPFALMSELKRLYSVMKYWNYEDRYTGKGIVQMLGYDYDDVKTHLRELGGYIDLWAAELASFVVPENFEFYHRQIALFANIYRDVDSNRSQFYIFRPHGFFSWREGEDAETTGKLLYTQYVDDSPKTVADIKEFMDTLIAYIRTSEDFVIMSGDIARACDKQGVGTMSVTNLDEMAVLEPIYNETVLKMIHNATICGAGNFTNDEITQDVTTGRNGGSLVYEPIMSASPFVPFGAKLIDFQHNVPTAQDVCDSMQWVTRFSDTAVTPPDTATLITSGTEIIMDANIWSFNSAGELQHALIVSYAPSNSSAFFLAQLSRFDWAPIVQGLSTTDGSLQWLHGEMDVYQMVDLNTIQNIHRAQLLGMFNVVNSDNL